MYRIYLHFYICKKLSLSKLRFIPYFKFVYLTPFILQNLVSICEAAKTLNSKVLVKFYISLCRSNQ